MSVPTFLVSTLLGLDEEFTDMDISGAAVTEDGSGDDQNDISICTFNEHKGKLTQCVFPLFLVCASRTHKFLWDWYPISHSELYAKRN